MRSQRSDLGNGTTQANLTSKKFNILVEKMEREVETF